ncbi:hypothetical protein M501DRAFT_995386 [Patellaria atrata CBS 101060]|uniref:Uncharacterized protein n=1 Tax=Patellaria atrata CBS 101060 TaxID=1346257 RepID=A0A9P4S7B5_9PEZI|nr:hypothetical protein M501DRAFT_995386 [Patellaria atrata CBS 101060]
MLVISDLLYGSNTKSTVPVQKDMKKLRKDNEDELDNLREQVAELKVNVLPWKRTKRSSLLNSGMHALRGRPKNGRWK